MSEFQKIIKYLAMAFAIYLVVMIVIGVTTLLGSFIFIFGDDKGITETMKVIKINNEDTISEINIDIKGASLIIEEGDSIAIETNNSYIETNQNKTKLEIKEKSHRLFRHNNESKVIVKIPSSLKIEEFRINAGAGKIEIASIIAKEVNLELGAGQAMIENLEATKKASIKGGAGEMIIRNGQLNNLNFEMGVGRAEITSTILGDSNIKAGVGELEVDILGNEQDYELEVDKGIGVIELNGKKISSNSRYGSGHNKLDIEGGVGKVNITFIENSKNTEPEDTSDITKKTTFIRTYKVLNKTSYNEENTYYLTLQLFQGEVDTVIIENFKENIIEGKTYEFTFEKNGSIKYEDKIKSIFNNYKLVAVTETNKTGLDQIQESIN